MQARLKFQVFKTLGFQLKKKNQLSFLGGWLDYHEENMSMAFVKVFLGN